MKQGNRYPCKDIGSGHTPGPDEALWKQAPKAELVDVVTGETPALSTFFQCLRSDGQGCLYLRFEGKSEGRHSTFRLHDEPLWKQDVFELFICDEGRLDRYRELQSSPWDVRFDGNIRYDEKGERHLDVSWDAEAWTSETVYDRKTGRLITVWKLPYEVFESKPKAGESWRMGVFRVAGEELQAWQMTGKANFHVPARFGYLDFE